MEHLYNFLGEGRSGTGDHFKEVVRSHTAILSLRVFLFKCFLSDALEKILQIRRREHFGHCDDPVYVNLSLIRLRQIVFKYGPPGDLVRPANRDDAVESARTKKSGIQLMYEVASRKRGGSCCSRA